MIKKIYFLKETPLSKWEYDRLGINLLKENGFEVEVWDCGPFLKPKYYQKIPDLNPDNLPDYSSFFTRDQMQKVISQLKDDCFVVCLIPYCFYAYVIYRAISKNRLKYCVSVVNPLPLSAKRGKLTLLFNKLKRFTFPKLGELLFMRTPFHYLGIQPATMVLTSGEKSISNYRYPINEKTEILWLHAWDYDVYLKDKTRPVQIDKNLGVFLDDYFPFHRDFSYLGIYTPVTPKVYYQLLCNFFDFMENTYNVKIIIAAHPSSNYENHPNYFKGRAVIKGKTAELVRQSGFTMLHSSTSINFAVLFRKPIIFITTNELQRSWYKQIILSMATLFKKEVINLDTKPFAIDFAKELTIDEQAYTNYQNTYIKKNGSEDGLFWQIFANRLKRL